MCSAERKRFVISCCLYKSLQLYSLCIETVSVWPWWEFVEKKPEFGIHCRTILRLLCGVSQINEHRARHEKVSDKCTCNGDVESVQHMLFKCDLTHCIRDTLWEKIELNAPVGLYRELSQMDIDVRTIFYMKQLLCLSLFCMIKGVWR